MKVAIWMTVVAVVFLGMLIPLIIVSVKREKKMLKEGIEVDGIIVQSERDARSEFKTTKTNLVEFVGDDGKWHVGVLNYRGEMPIGRRVKVKYLPGKYDCAAFVSQELD